MSTGFRPSRLLARVFVVAWVGVAAHAGVPWIDTDFESDPIGGGWGSNTPLNDPGNEWTSDDSYSGSRSLRAADGLWFSPFLDLEPFEYYAVSVHARVTGRGYFGPSYKSAAVYETGAAWEPNVYAFRALHDVAEARLYFHAPVGGHAYLDDVVVERISRDEATTIAEERWNGMPPFAFEGGRSGVQHLRRTLSALEDGKTVRVVMLGDSIVDDTSHSSFELLVEREFPGSRIEVVTSTRNATGCWWYREDDSDTGIPRVETWVTDHDPDLVLIGGISHGPNGHDDEIDAIRDVIRQIRAWNPETDIVLMSELGGTNDPLARPHLVDRADPAGPDWRARMSRLAAAECVAFVDMTTPWARYVDASGRPIGDLLRDSIHLNEYGSEVAGRILARLFFRDRGERPRFPRTSNRRPALTTGSEPGAGSPATLRERSSRKR